MGTLAVIRVLVSRESFIQHLGSRLSSWGTWLPLNTYIYMRSERIGLNDNSIRCGMAEESLCHIEGTLEVKVDRLDELVDIDIIHGSLRPNHARIADQDVKLAFTEKRLECCVDLALIRDVGREDGDVDFRVLVLDRGFGLEERLLTTAEECNSWSACFGEG